jgi:predicted RNA-binding Zn ribbon-like protein
MNTSRKEFLAQGHGKTGPWVDLVNSQEWDTYGNPTDHLDNPAWIPFFLRQWHFMKPARESAPLAKLKALRSALRKSCEALSARKPVPPPQLHMLNGVLNVAGKQQVVQRQNGLQIQFVPQKSGWDWTMAEIVRSFAETLSSGEAARIKSCQNADCRWIFYDETKARTRCWCSSKSCGNRERVRRARARIKD